MDSENLPHAQKFASHFQGKCSPGTRLVYSIQIVSVVPHAVDERHLRNDVCHSLLGVGGRHYTDTDTNQHKLNEYLFVTGVAA